MGWYIIIGSLPIVVLGVLLKDVIERDFRNLWIIGTTLIVMGVVLGIADRVGRTDRDAQASSPCGTRSLMGLAQALALVPGVSRSGATISMGRFLGFDREAATRFAFLLAIPAVSAPGSSSSRRSRTATTTSAGGRRSSPRWSRSSSATPPSPGCCATSARTRTRPS